MVSSPLPESGPADESLVTKRMQHKWLTMTSEARSHKTMQLPPGSFGRLSLGGIRPPETTTLERPHVGTLVDSPSWAQPPIIPTKVLTCDEEEHVGRDPPASAPVVLSHLPFTSSQVAASGTREQRWAIPDVSCPICWPKESMIIIKRSLFHATKFKVVC